VFYDVIDSDFLFGFGGTDYYTVTFDGKFNPYALGAIYMDLPGVVAADPNGWIGGENRWTPLDNGNGTWTWTIDDGFMDCFDGCDCHKVYTIDVSARGTVTLVDYTTWGQEWCRW
jgi:hypothetical protein